MSFTYACRMGASIENTSPQMAMSPMAAHSADVKPSSTSTLELAMPTTMSVLVRLRKTRRAWGAAQPPTICDPATSAAARPAIEYDFA
jgi:hypothetical protein